MAPALNEPLSPTTTEKLTKSTVSVTTVPVTRSTRRQSAFGGAPTLKTASTPIGVGIGVVPTTSNCNNRDQKARRSNTPDTTTILTRRRTRSKESVPKLSANNKNINIKTTTTTTTEPMGLTAALSTSNKNSIKSNNNNNNAQTSFTKENKNNNTPESLESVKADPATSTTTETTQEILANLTINFEEAISAEICLRKQLLDSNLNKEATKKTNGTELKDILVIKSSDVSVATNSRSQEEQSQHMESVLGTSAETLDKILPPNNNENESETQLKTNEPQNENNSEVDKNEQQLNSISQNNLKQNEEEIQDVEAEEKEEDILEARLSQLDGSICDTSKITTTIGHDLQDLHNQLQLSPVKSTQDELKDLQDQLQLSPNKTSHDELKELQAQLQLSPVKTNTHLDLHNLQSQLQLSPSVITSTAEPETKTDIGTMQILVDEQVGVEQLHHEQQHIQESTNIPHIVANTGDIEEEDLEEVIRALKGFDPATAGPDTLCDLNAIFGEVYQNMNYEDVNTTQTPAITSSISPIKNNPLHEAQLEIDKIQQAVQRKLEFLIRRLRKLQARYMCKHTSEELGGIFEYTIRTVNNTLGSSGQLGLKSTDKNELSPKPVSMSVISARPLPELWQDERECPVPATQVYSLMRKVDTAAKAQQLCTVSSSTTNNSLNTVRKSRKSSAALDATQPSTTIEPPAATVSGSIIPTLDPMAVEEMAQVTGMLQAELREVQQSIDSEATESSSGCESADEMISYNNHIQQPLPIEKRAAWRYARDRAAIAARWSWLMSHIADLEIKIRQHTELYNEIVRKKGPVIDDIDNESPTSTAQEDNDRGSCRTRGYLSSQFRKRKLLQTTNIHTISKKAARPSTIKCGCQWPMQPCALCTGRSDPTAPRELPNTMVKYERVALLDSGFHPVLSLPEDVSSSLYSEAVARLSDWQQHAMRCQVKTIAKSVWKAEREASSGGMISRKYDGSTVKRRYIKKKDRLAAEAAVANATASRREERDSTGAISNAIAESGSMAEKNGTESATSTTPLVANRIIKQNSLVRKRITTTTGATTREMMDVDTHYQSTTDYPAQKYEGYNKRINQTLNSHKNNNRFHRNRKAFSSSSSSSSFSVTAPHRQSHQINNPSSQSKNNPNHHHQLQQTQQYHNSNGNSSSSETANNNNNLHMHDNWDYVTSTRSCTASPIHAHSNQYRSERKRSSYDIDNIVIPYSVAAATRVEIIPYKEIATPKWRVIGSADECDESVEECEEKTRSVSRNECTEKDIAEGDNIDPKSEIPLAKTEHCIAEEKNSTEINNKEKSVDESKIPHEKVSSANIEEESKAPDPPPSVEVREQELECEKAKESTELKKETKELLEKNESVDNKAKSFEKIENDASAQDKEEAKKVEPIEEKTFVEENIEDEKKVKVKINENDLFKNEKETIQFRERADISLDETKEDDQEGVEESLEDITDAVMAIRHERGLIEERRKFQTYLKFPWTTRSRANRRGDSRAESSGANTPDPTSPAPNPSHLVGGDQESIPSPATTLALSAPTTPFTPLDSTTPDALHGPFAAFDNRKHRNNNRKRCRTTSSKKDQERRSTSPDYREIILPYEPLKFPLSDGEFEELQCYIPKRRRADVKQECNNRKPIGRYGRGRNGLRRQGHNTTSNLIRSLRPRLSNRPYVLDTKEITNSGDLVGIEQTVVANGEKKLRLSVENCGVGDNTEETEDETETCAFEGMAVSRKDGLYTEEEDEDDDLDEDEDDGFPRNPLATADDDLLVSTSNADISHDPKARDNSEVIDSAYAAYVGQSDLFSDGEMDSSDAEPFKDDDPNDPEWSGEPRRSRM